MFNKDLKLKVKKLEQRIEDLENPYIGEVVSDRNCGFSWPCYSFCTAKHTSIKLADIQDEIGDKLKIDGNWFNKDQIVFYRDEKRIQREIKKLVEKYSEKEVIEK